MFKVQRAIRPLVAGLLILAPLSARADVTDDVVSFFNRTATEVKARVVALPSQVAALPGQLGISTARPVAPEAAVIAPAVTPSMVLNKDIALQADLSQVKVPAVTPLQVALPTPSVETPLRRLFCAEYARVRTGFPVFGDAKYWWERAKNIYDRVAEPVAESVMVFSTTSRLKRGHVAVVTDIVSDREIRVDQANWMNKGEIDHSTPVLDVSPRNDWSQVRVWDVRSRQFGAHVYAISGFILKAPMRQAMRD